MSDSDTEIREISKRRFTYRQKIGEGAFGTAYKAQLAFGRGQNRRNETVAVKVLKFGTAEDVWDECNRMVDLDHPNILRLIGITTYRDDEIPWIITEYMEGGDLLSYIWNYPGGSMTAYGMVKFAYGIACGMAYLHHEIFPYLRHCDLAARNCLVGPNWTIKISDFGKFEENSEDCYYDGEQGRFKPCPIRWMPPENVPTRYNSEPRFTRKGDVWAFGVVLFEIWTRGSHPYDGLDNDEVLQALDNGDDPSTYRDVFARSYILELTEDCWENESLDRPNFKQIKQRFEDNDSNIVDA